MTTKGRPGGVTIHPARAEIELQLAKAVPLRVLAKRYGLSPDALWRHKARLPPQLKQALIGKALKPDIALDALRVEESESLLLNLQSQRIKLLKAQDTAIETEQLSILAAISAQIHRNLELVSRYLGLLVTHHQHTQISILLAPEYLTLRATLVQSLAPYPEARHAVTEALQRIESAAPRPAPITLEASPQDPERAAG